MKEFEKWWNKEIRPYIHNPKDKDVVKAGWMAALRWVLSMDDGFCNCGAMNVDEHSSTYEKIENELKEE